MKGGMRSLLGRVRGELTWPLPERDGRGQPRQPDRQIRLPVAGIYVRWKPRRRAGRPGVGLEGVADPTCSVGIYLALAQGAQSMAQLFDLGLQTDMWDPERLRGAGKGLIFSTWWTFDASATRLAPGGFRGQLGAHEGRFVGVRQPYPWVIGDYRITLVCFKPAPRSPCSRRLVRPLHPADGGSSEDTRPGNADLVGDRTWIGGRALPVLDMAPCRHSTRNPPCPSWRSTAVPDAWREHTPLGRRSHGLRRRAALPRRSDRVPCLPLRE